MRVCNSLPWVIDRKYLKYMEDRFYYDDEPIRLAWHMFRAAELDYKYHNMDPIEWIRFLEFF